MRATGIVRRIDDLGRVVIPKEIRRIMNIREGDPLEIYTNSDGTVIFKKYHPIGDRDWAKAKTVVSKILDKPFALFDRYEECQVYTDKEMIKAFTSETFDGVATNIMVDGETEGYLVTPKNCENVYLAIKVLGALFSE